MNCDQSAAWWITHGPDIMQERNDLQAQVEKLTLDLNGYKRGVVKGGPGERYCEHCQQAHHDQEWVELEAAIDRLSLALGRYVCMPDPWGRYSAKAELSTAPQPKIRSGNM